MEILITAEFHQNTALSFNNKQRRLAKMRLAPWRVQMNSAEINIIRYILAILLNSLAAERPALCLFSREKLGIRRNPSLLSDFVEFPKIVFCLLRGG